MMTKDVLMLVGKGRGSICYANFRCRLDPPNWQWWFSWGNEREKISTDQVEEIIDMLRSQVSDANRRCEDLENKNNKLEEELKEVRAHAP